MWALPSAGPFWVSGDKFDCVVGGDYRPNLSILRRRPKL